MIALHLGDCLDVLKTLPDDSVDAVVTEPPYGLSFMGKTWDYDVPSVAIWRECLRVLRPGGHLLAFAGTRTQHRMAVAIEDAGFEIRDMIAWVYGSGFPKSLDVSKAIDKRGGNVATFTEFRDAVKAAMRRNNVSRQRLQDALGNFMLSHYLTAGSQPAVPVLRDYRIIRDTVGLGHKFDDLFNDEAEREVVGQGKRQGGPPQPMWGDDDGRKWDITAPATDEAKQWEGWGTALKPAMEPITVARKPLIGTVAENVLAHGTGALNIDAARVGTETISVSGKGSFAEWQKTTKGFTQNDVGVNTTHNGRWPANLIHDGSDEVVGLLNEAARFFYCAKASKADRDAGCEGMEERKANKNGSGLGRQCSLDARKESAGDDLIRSRNHHPTVKPTELMRYLVRLVTPPGGVVLDPFMGSGSTGKACVLEGFGFVGIEREPEYMAIAQARIDAVQSPWFREAIAVSAPAPTPKPTPASPIEQLSMFESI